MTRTWPVLCVALLAFPLVFCDHGNGALGNSTVGDKLLSLEGGSIPTNWTQKSVKKELAKMPNITTSAENNKTLDIPGNTTSTVAPVVPRVDTKNVTAPIGHANGTNSTKLPPDVALPDKSNKTISLTNSTTVAPATSSTTTTTTTTTTPRPKKPHLTWSVEDDPSILEVPAKAPKHPPSSVLDVEEPVAQLSQENILEMPVNHRDYVVPIVVLIFAIPMVLGLATVVVRRFRDFWLTRHYRRMDYLVDGMYND